MNETKQEETEQTRTAGLLEIILILELRSSNFTSFEPRWFYEVIKVSKEDSYKSTWKTKMAFASDRVS